MKNIKIVFWVIIIGFIILLLFQNQDVIIAKQSFKLDLMFVDEYHTPELPNGIIYFVCLLTGFFIAVFAGLADRFKFKKNIRNLKIANKLHLEEISVLKRRLESLQEVSPESTETIIESADRMD
ncbi:MAG: hypothetical protein L6247_07110 [Desulfobacteraceae bacterium]|nr:hypothetical protein [Pseudomonadota bacterium]MBU4463867.1 hypothetical protein [Pseudomonadota bacterium]MCG2755314.1 hypothetical protein [Desulfobacteraceae bacterium]